MSQILKNLASGPVPPAVPTSFVTDSGTAIPSGNILDLTASYTTSSDDDGIQSSANPNLSNIIQISLTNRLFGSGTSINGSILDLITFNLLSTPSCYRMSFEVSGRDIATGDGVGYTIFGTAKTDGAVASLVETPYTDVDEDISLIDADTALVPVGNAVVLSVTGVAGKIIAYKAVGTYLVV